MRRGLPILRESRSAAFLDGLHAFCPVGTFSR